MRAGYQIALDHCTHDALVAGGDLGGYVVADLGLAAVVLARVGVAEVNHDARGKAGFFHFGGGLGNALGGVVDGAPAAAQDHVAVGISGGHEDGRLAVLGVPEEGVRMGGGEDGVDGDLHAAGGAVFESHRAGDAADELAVDLAFGGARADGSPGDEPGDVLRGDHVEEFGAGGHAHLGQIHEQVAGQAQAVVDLVGLIEIWIVDEALPSNGGARLLKVDAHGDAQVGGELLDGGFEQGGVFAGGLGVVNGAGACENQQARVAAVEDGGDLVAGVGDGGRGGFRDGAFFLEKDGREDDAGPLDAKIFCCVKHG